MSWRPSKDVLELRQRLLGESNDFEDYGFFLQLLDICIAGADGDIYKLWYNDEYSRSMCSFDDFIAEYFQNALTLKDE